MFIRAVYAAMVTYDATTDAVIAEVQRDGTAWLGGTTASERPSANSDISSGTGRANQRIRHCEMPAARIAVISLFRPKEMNTIIVPAKAASGSACCVMKGSWSQT